MVLLLHQMCDIESDVVHHMVQLLVHMLRLLATEVLHPQILVGSPIREPGGVQISGAGSAPVRFVMVDLEDLGRLSVLCLCLCQVMVECQEDLHLLDFQGVSKPLPSQDTAKVNAWI